jgi:hypothetical protein
MSQSNEAAERSASVVRGSNYTEASYGCPVVEIAPGVWQLRAVAERDAEIALLRAERDTMERRARTFEAANVKLIAERDAARALLPKAWEAGAQSMRSTMADWLMCGCEWDQRAAVASAAISDGPNSGARWRAGGRSDCLCLLAIETLDLPALAPPPDLAEQLTRETPHG